MSAVSNRGYRIARRRFLGTIGVLGGSFALAQALSACAAQPAATPAPGAATTKPAVGGGNLTLVDFSDAQVLNPILFEDTGSQYMSSLIFNSLIGLDPTNGTPGGELAESWQTSNDGLTYTFKLRSGIKWHDGQDFTAEDVKFTFDAIFDDEVNSPIQSLTLDALAGPDAIVVKDAHTIEFTLVEPYAPFLVQDFMIRGILPKHLLASKKGQDFNTADFNTKNPIGTGPFEFKEWVPDSHLILEANEHYFRGRPKIDRFVYKVVKDSTTVAAQLKTGEADWGSFEPAMLDELRQVPHLDVKSFDEFFFTFYGYQLDKTRTDLFQEKIVRQALFHALDRPAMLDAILFGQGAVADSIFPIISWARDPKDNPKYDYNPAKAKAMLDEAGWKPGADGIREKNGKKLAFTIHTNAGNKTREALVAAMQQQWKEIGVQATPKLEETAAFINRLQETKDFDVFLIGFNWSPDPDQSAMWTTAAQSGGFNVGGYSNPQVDQLLAEGLKEIDQNKRMVIYKQVDKIVLDDLPSPIMFFTKSLVGLNKRVQNLVPNAFNHFYNGEQWVVTDGK